MTGIKYDEAQYQQALAIVNSYESTAESLMITAKIMGNAVTLVEQTKRDFPKLSKPQIVNKLLNELYLIKQKK